MTNNDLNTPHCLTSYLQKDYHKNLWKKRKKKEKDDEKEMSGNKNETMT